MNDILQQACDYIRANKKNVYSLCLWDGKDFHETRLQEGSLLNNVYSVSKSITATAFGMLSYRGRISLNDPVLKYLPRESFQNASENWQKAEIVHLLTHSLGQEEGYLFGESRFSCGDDLLSYIAHQPLPLAPGEKMVYTNSTFYLMSLIIERITGKTLFDFLRQELFVPLHFHGYAAGVCPLGHTFGASEFFLSVKDMAKLGALYVNNGVWEGKRYFGADFAKEASRVRFICGDHRYGLGFWSLRTVENVFYADGAHGQLILIDPENRRVLAMQSYDDFDSADFLPAVFQKESFL